MAFPSEVEAKFYLWTRDDRAFTDVKYCYECPYCSQWHLTKREQVTGR